MALMIVDEGNAANGFGGTISAGATQIARVANTIQPLPAPRRQAPAQPDASWKRLDWCGLFARAEAASKARR